MMAYWRHYMGKYQLIAIKPDELKENEDFDYLIDLYKIHGNVQLPIVGPLHNNVYYMDEMEFLYEIGTKKRNFKKIFKIRH